MAYVYIFIFQYYVPKTNRHTYCCKQATSGRRKRQKLLAETAKPQYIRVHIQYAMIRSFPAKALLQVKHIHAPFCMEHAGQRVTECFLRHVQDVVLSEGGTDGKVSPARQKKNVDRLNAAFKQHGAQYKIKPKKEGDGWYDASCNGQAAKSLTATASYVNGQGELQGWLHEMWGVHSEWAKQQGMLWRQWNDVLFTGRALEPSAEQVQSFGPICRRLFRYGKRGFYFVIFMFCIPCVSVFMMVLYVVL